MSDLQQSAASSPAGPATLDAFDRRIASDGWVMFERVIPPEDLPALRAAVVDSVAACGRLQVASGATALPDGTAHHCVGQHPALDGFLARGWLHDAIDRYFGGAAYILHAFNPATVQPDRDSYLHRIHRDVRTHAGAFRLMLNMLVMVDPFTPDNGATHVLSGSHHDAEPPAEALFHARSSRLTGPAGSIVLFDSNLWHAAGRNLTQGSRAALTLSFSRAFVKQQMDYPRFLGPAYGRGLSPAMRQLLGYEAMVPACYDEFYRRPAERLYRADQG